ncbi:hypothetical protein [Calothrix sp. PCC 7507]|uniref:hypothetical protein n=1 Tax=Calothrix sp. PCC 7507 TaxID=99598 RepID=UPI00029F32BE|nr:hypothetical protein [Calothrix sp. PCC 7507]AFY30692.1 hypothetical protein Cal7507_0190 [Calothrix sp. PCC 7507]
MFNKSVSENRSFAKQVLVVSSLMGMILTSVTTQASADVVKGTQCHPNSPVGFCCPNDGRPSGPYCPDRRKIAPALRAQN